MRTAALLLLLASATSHAMVLKCRVPSSGTFETTTERQCPSGTNLEKTIPDEMICHELKTIKTHYERQLDQNADEYNLLSKFRNASNEMTKYGCRL